MLKNYYFYQWKQILVDLKGVTDLDIYLQQSKHQDPQLCVAAQTLTGVLARYLVLHKAIVTCLQHNLQVQKKVYLRNVANTVFTRMAEIKTQLRKLEYSNNLFFTNGLITHKLTPSDIEPIEFINDGDDEEDMRDFVQEIFEQMQRKKEDALLRLQEENAEKADELAVFEDGDQNKPQNTDSAAIYAVEKVIPPEVLEMIEKINLIKASEKLRQTRAQMNEAKLKKEIWVKELMGVLRPPAPLAVRTRAAALMKHVIRSYFKHKRDRIKDLQRQEMLNLLFLKKPPKVISENDEADIKMIRAVTKTFEAEQGDVREDMKQQYLERRGEDLIDAHKDFLRAWFAKWHDELRLFYDIPKKGGSVLILREEVLEPEEWTERYDAYIAEQKEKKNKSKAQLRQEKEAVKKEKTIQKQLEKAQQKRQKKKSIPTGYTYPESTTVGEIQKTLEAYTREWHDYDDEERADAKIKFVKEKVLSDLLEEVKTQTCFDVDPDMTLELKALWKALKFDYEHYYEKPMPEKIVGSATKRKRKKKEPRPPKPENPDNPYECLEVLAEHGLLIQYEDKKFEDFVGDHNFAGIVVLTEAALVEINPAELQKRELFSAAYLQHLLKPLITCVKTIKPLVIYIKNIQHVFPKRASKEAKANARMLSDNLINKVLKVNKADRVTIVASLSEPWACTSGKVLSCFPEVLLAPDTTYSAVSQLLKDWVLSNRQIPPDFPTYSLAQTLQGLQYGFLKDALNNYLTGERILRIAAYGLSVTELFDYIMNLANQRIDGAKTEYDQYRQWYLDNTTWGKKETMFIQKQKELKELLQKIEQKNKKKKKVEAEVEEDDETPEEAALVE